jgi:hypothetical protein
LNLYNYRCGVRQKQLAARIYQVGFGKNAAFLRYWLAGIPAL